MPIDFNKLNIVQTEVDKLSQAIKTEEAKGDKANVDFIVSLAKKVHALMMASEGHLNATAINKHKSTLDDIVVELQKSYNDTKVRNTQWISAVIHFASALAAVGGCTSYTVRGFEFSKLAKVSEGIAHGANGVDKFTSMWSTEQEGVRSKHQHEMDSAKRLLDDINGMLARIRQQEQESHRQNTQADEAKARTFAAVRHN